MSRQATKKLIEEIEEHRGSRVLVYMTGSRGAVGAQMGNDAVRVIYDHLRALGKVEKLDLVLCSHGGDIDVPWRIANALRATAETWNVLVPLYANSAATLLSLGADQIVLGPQGELGPIDPNFSFQRPEDALQQEVGVEDVMAYVKFVKDRAGLSDQEALTASLGKLTERLDPPLLGRIYRTHTHIREVAGRMLRSRGEPAQEQAMATIIETLAERVYAHGHAVGFRDAEEIGLPVQQAEPELDALMWSLVNEYEDEMKLRTVVDPRSAIEGDDTYEEDVKLAAVESALGLHEFGGKLTIKAKRQMPPQLALNMNMNLQLPPGAQPNQVNQQGLQQIMQALQQQIADAASKAVEDAVKAQAPLQGVDVFIRDQAWVCVEDPAPAPEAPGSAPVVADEGSAAATSGEVDEGNAAVEEDDAENR